MYIGCNRAKCIAHDHLVEGNEIHDLRANGRGGNDGIEIKYGSYRFRLYDSVGGFSKESEGFIVACDDSLRSETWHGLKPI